MAQDQNPVPPVARTGLAQMIAKGQIKDGTVPQDQVPTLAPKISHVPDGKIWNIGDAVREWAYQSLTAVVKGERVGWDVSLTLAPAAGGAFVSAYALVIYMPSVLLGQPPIGTVRIIPDHPDQNQVRAAVLSAVGELKDKQNEMLSERRTLMTD